MLFIIWNFWGEVFSAAVRKFSSNPHREDLMFRQRNFSFEYTQQTESYGK